MVVQDTVETSQTVTVNKHKHVAINFGMQELALSLDDFSKRILEPAMAVLAAAVESDALGNMTKDIYNIIDGDAAALDFSHVADAQAKLGDTLTPPDSRTLLLSNAHVAKFLNANKGLFNPQGGVSKQYRKGILGEICGFEVGSSSLVSNHTTGTEVKATAYLTNNPVVGALMAVDTGTLTFLAGDIVTFADLFRVHPETKVSTGILQQFVVTANHNGAGDMAISPATVTSGAKQNVTGLADGKAVVKVGAAADELLNGSLAFHKEAFVFVSADLPDVSQFGAWGARRTVDGMRFNIAKQFDILNYKIPARIDIIYGYKTRYPEIACRIHADG
ncbi:hypothetical protein LCGC14_2173740 [marine sediment metagenome]|uniref:Uncharacterized protein n=1 Tax=marine sediment metagenome TaxID=412755 RepID=A0A0F9DP64_9ZZZZ